MNHLKPRCIFCKNNSENSRSVEHIIPESLGNKDHILPPGLVCDKCNNYFSRKIEGPLLNEMYFRTLRSEQGLLSKRNRAVQVPTIILPARQIVNMAFYSSEKDNSVSIEIPNEKDWEITQDFFSNNKKGTLIIPKNLDLPAYGILSRFLAKTAIEALALKFVNDNELLNDLIDNEQIDLIRNYARYNEGVTEWPYYQRIIYPKDKKYISDNGQEYQVIHEFDFVITDSHELYFVIAIFGVEYTINLAGPYIDGYKEWLLKMGINRHYILKRIII